MSCEDSKMQYAGNAGSERQCTVCQEAQWKYKCPGCEARTCSLACFKQHKNADGASSGLIALFKQLQGCQDRAQHLQLLLCTRRGCSLSFKQNPCLWTQCSDGGL